MNAKATAATETWHAHPVDRTSQTDDQRIKNITVLPPPEHLIRFFPIRGTSVEALITDTRRNIHNIMSGKDDRLLVLNRGFAVYIETGALPPVTSPTPWSWAPSTGSSGRRRAC